MTHSFMDISRYEGVPMGSIRLQLDDTRLNYGARLSDYNIRAGATVTLAMPPSGERHLEPAESFIVKSIAGRQLQIASQFGSSAADIKNDIAQLTGIPQVEQRLLLRGKGLRDERQLGTLFDLQWCHQGLSRRITRELLASK